MKTITTAGWRRYSSNWRNSQQGARHRHRTKENRLSRFHKRGGERSYLSGLLGALINPRPDESNFLGRQILRRRASRASALATLATHSALSPLTTGTARSVRSATSRSVGAHTRTALAATASSTRRRGHAFSGSSRDTASTS